jgi:hypothetical protein
MDMKRLYNNNILKYETNNDELLGTIWEHKKAKSRGVENWGGGDGDVIDNMVEIRFQTNVKFWHMDDFFKKKSYINPKVKIM